MGTNGGDTDSAVGISLVYWRCSNGGDIGANNAGSICDVTGVALLT